METLPARAKLTAWTEGGGYALASHTGNENGLILIVVDDEAHTLHDYECHGDLDQTIAVGRGLFQLFNAASVLHEVRAIAFFRLEKTLDANKSQVIPHVHRWLAALGGNPRVFFLVDMYWGPPSAPVAVGHELLGELEAAFHQCNAKYAIFSAAGRGQIDGLVGAASRYPAFSKDAVAEVGAKGALPEELKRWLGIQKEITSPLTWECETWRRLRHALWEYAARVGAANPTVDHALWAHHLPFGGTPTTKPPWGNAGERAPIIQGIRRALSAVVDTDYLKPECRWEMGPASPPLRALAQFDSDANDLTTALYLAKEEVRRDMQYANDVSLQLTSSSVDSNLRHDYLWFNVSALACALRELAAGFDEFVGRARKPGTSEAREVRSGFGFNEEEGIAEIQWQVHEFVEENELRASVSQYLRAPPQKGEEIASFWRKRIRFPAPDEAKKQVAHAYRLLARAGAEVDVDKGGTLQIRLRAEEQSDKGGTWCVRNLADGSVCA